MQTSVLLIDALESISVIEDVGGERFISMSSRFLDDANILHRIMLASESLNIY